MSEAKSKADKPTKVAERRQAESTLRRLAGELGTSYLQVTLSEKTRAVTLECLVNGCFYKTTEQNLDDAFVALSHRVKGTEKSPF